MEVDHELQRSKYERYISCNIRIPGEYTAKLSMISRYILRMKKVISNFMISFYFPGDISVKTWDLSIP